MTRETLVQKIHEKGSFLCVGLNPDLGKLPKHLLNLEDPIFEFNKAIIDATKDYCVAYKPNTAFYEAYGLAGWKALEKTIAYIPKTHFIIADAKRGDIGNTSKKYAEAFFKQMSCDAITVAPYMGKDSVTPFYGFDEKWVIILGLTSNEGSSDFQLLEMSSHQSLYEQVLAISSEWGNSENTMFVVGATHPKAFENIRKIIPDHFLLIPGVGAQGGDLASVCHYALNMDCGILVNSSRGIIYASNGTDFAEKAGLEAKDLNEQMRRILDLKK